MSAASARAGAARPAAARAHRSDRPRSGPPSNQPTDVNSCRIKPYPSCGEGYPAPANLPLAPERRQYRRGRVLGGHHLHARACRRRAASGVSPSETRITARRTRRPRRSSAWMTICGLRMPTSTSATSNRRSRHTRAAAAPRHLPLELDAEIVERRLERGLELLAPDHEHARAAGADRRPQHGPQLVGVDRLAHDPLAGELLAAREHRHEHDRRRRQLAVRADLGGAPRSRPCPASGCRA